ncbi:hypothetical protein FGG08_006990 [Glutinoglossum americanum]|uniref:Uncharacterized protein n=1 Tax=Glutinoglossum americanum TaxID=1670608 RepID=A0A9P8KZT6_9PEZI|nr:hypothetical protein FGG08_006990 [Glutinoglossum americanum]
MSDDMGLAVCCGKRGSLSAVRETALEVRRSRTKIRNSVAGAALVDPLAAAVRSAGCLRAAFDVSGVAGAEAGVGSAAFAGAGRGRDADTRCAIGGARAILSGAREGDKSEEREEGE